MIDNQTPLSQIARLLGAQTAILVDRQTPELQTLVLIATRAYLVHLQFQVVNAESEGPLDPITLQEKLHGFADAFLMAYKGVRRA